MKVSQRKIICIQNDALWWNTLAGACFIQRAAGSLRANSINFNADSVSQAFITAFYIFFFRELCSDIEFDI